EQATGDENYNLITAAIHEYNLDVGSAIAWAASSHTELQRKFIDGLEKIPSWGNEVDDQLQEYIHGLANWARANYCWSFESGRYFGTKGAEIEQFRFVPLLPKVAIDPHLHKEAVVVADIEL
ncbi:hypothetical protein BJ138DRAFT_1162491, partial [Hygrophoropsis aurantiaca]